MNAIAKFQEPRLPFHPAVEERFGVDKSGWKVLVEAIFPAAKTVDSVTMALGYCRARKLDPFKRPVHIVPVWSSAAGAMVETVWPSISELRTTACRTGEYAGIDEVEFGPPIERTFTGMVGKKGDKEQVTVKLTFPEWGKITVYRFINGQRVAFHSPKIFWLETYATRDRWCDVPNEQWARRPYGQFEKCIEAAGLRRAFPEEIGNEYAAEEMEGQRLTEDTPSVASPSPPKVPSPPSAPRAAQSQPTVIEAEPLNTAGLMADWEMRLKMANRALQDEIFEAEIEPRREAGEIGHADYNALVNLLKEPVAMDLDDPNIQP